MLAEAVRESKLLMVGAGCPPLASLLSCPVLAKRHARWDLSSRPLGYEAGALAFRPRGF